MTASLFSVDPAPNHVISGAVEVDEASHPAGIAYLLHAHLKAGRFLAAVGHRPDQKPDEAVTFTVACDPQLRVLHVDEHGALRPGASYTDVEKELSEALGQPVSLWVDPDLIEDDGEVIDAGEYTEEQAGDLDDVEDVSEYGVPETGEGALPVFNPEAFEDETPSRVLVFSHRGVSNGFFFAWTIKTDRVEGGALDDWSVFRFLDKHSIADVPDASKKELPSIRAVFTEGETDGWAYMNVATPNARGMQAHVVYPTIAAHARPVLEAEQLKPDARSLLSVLVNDHLAHDSQANLLLADESIDIDAAAFHASLAPDFTGTTLDRLEAILVALRVPAKLAAAAVRGAELPNARTYTRRPLLRGLWQVSVDGMAGMSALGGKRGFFRRLDDYLRARPLLAYPFSLIELALGEQAIALSLLHLDGFWKWLVVVVGAMLVIDAILDLILTTTRVWKKRRHA